MDYCFVQEITEERRAAELQANLARGNHKSATSEPGIMVKALHKDVHHGCSLPFPSDLVHKLKGSLVQSCGLASQYGFETQADPRPVLRDHWRRLIGEQPC
jgi:hypothetical protein